jgi:alkanesulfonate monooxygenase SsuD/methylene tetrahydromethanopterin reductase-like flavin-dependent oxidoreductase (luciferase family)
MDVLEEQLQIVLGAWGPGPLSFAGEHYRLQDLDARPKPVQEPHPPLIVGGSGGARSVRLAAAYADEYNTPFATVEQARERKQRLEEACERAGREPMPFSLMTSALIGADRSEVDDRVRRRAEKEGGDGSAWPETGLVGTLDDAAEQLSAFAEAGVSRVMCQHLVHDDLDMVARLGELNARLS